MRSAICLVLRSETARIFFQAMALVSCVSLVSCITGASQQKSPKQSQPGAASNPNSPNPGESKPGASDSDTRRPHGDQGQGSVQAAAPAQTPDPCVVLPQLDGGPPSIAASHGLVLTRMLKPCVTRDGRNGFADHGPWMAMGFPCTGGNGLVDWKGTNWTRPKMVSFILATDCAVEPSDPARVAAILREKFSLPPTAPLIAYNPFVVQFWEIPGLGEADTGFTVELRADDSLGKPWARLLKNEPLRVQLYGRENAWVQGDYIYSVTADLMVTGRNRFKLQIVDAQTMGPDDIDAVRQRCEQLRPRRNCSQIF